MSSTARAAVMNSCRAMIAQAKQVGRMRATLTRAAFQINPRGPMTDRQIIAEIRHAVATGRGDGPAQRKRLHGLVNQPGAAELLLRIARSGTVADAQLAALALPFARAPLVRKALQKEVRTATGERRV